jgi:hypothetical protein
MTGQQDRLSIRLRKLAADGSFDELCREFSLVDDQDLTVGLRLLKSRAIRLADNCEIPLEVVEDLLLEVLSDDPNNVEAMIELAHYYVIQCREDEALEVYLNASRTHGALEVDLARLKNFLD